MISSLQELAEYMGMNKLIARLRDVTLQTAFEGVFPRDDPVNTRFAINFFTSIGKTSRKTNAEHVPASDR
jgi:hypothetical protein